MYEQIIRDLVQKHKIKEEIVPLEIAKLKNLNAQHVYQFKSQKNFSINGLSVGEAKNNFILEYGRIMNFSFKRFTGINGIFNNVNFIEVKNVNARFNNVIYANCTFRNVSFNECELKGTHFINCTFESCLITNSILSSSCFYHCIHDSLTIDNTCNLNNVEYIDIDEQQVDGTESIVQDGASQLPQEDFEEDINEMEQKRYLTKPIESGEIYQFFKIENKHFFEQNHIMNVTFSDCEINLKEPLTKITFSSCEFLHCTFPNQTFDKCNFIDTSFENVQFNEGVKGLKFVKCKFENVSAPTNGFVKCQFEDCTYDDKSKYIPEMENCKVDPITQEDEKYAEGMQLIAGYRSILLTTMKELSKVDLADKNLIDDISKMINILGKKTNYEQNYVDKVKVMSKQMEIKELKELIKYLQDTLFEKI